MAFTEPDYQDQGIFCPCLLYLTDRHNCLFSVGLMSLLIREAFENPPNEVFTLETTTPKSRDQYAHYGYKVRALECIRENMSRTKYFHIFSSRPL